jgi:hypothetical protein
MGLCKSRKGEIQNWVIRENTKRKYESPGGQPGE